MGLRFEYPATFMLLWSAHPVGVKKSAYDAWKKLRLSDDETAELVEHLRQRHKDDVKWREGVFVPHLATFLNQRRWEDDYQRVRPDRTTTSTVTQELWQKMGYANEADYYAGRRMH